MPIRTSRSNQPLPFQTTLELEKNTSNNFWQYEKVPNTTISKCDIYEITNFRTPQFVKKNIFGGENNSNVTVITSHIVVLGDKDGNELVTENGFSFLYNEVCF